MKTTSTGRTEPRGRRPVFRLGAAAAAGVILAAVVPGLAGSKEAEFIPGSGNAYAQIYRVGPTAARLSLAPVIGLSLADFQNTEGRGAATLADWAAIGVAQSELPDNTPALRVTSSQEGADEGVTQYGREEAPTGTSDGTNSAGLIELFARATKAPLGESRIKLQGFSVPGVIEVGTGEAATSSGVFDRPGGKLRISTATTTISGALLGDTVKLNGLRWEAIQKTDANNKASFSGSFSVQSASIAGGPIPIPLETDNVKPLFDAINAALAPIGFSVTAPAFDKEGGVSTMSPLQLQIINSPAGRQYLAPILADFREQEMTRSVVQQYIDLAQQLNEESDEEIPDLSVGVLAADLTLGILSGASQLHIELGGVDAFTEGQLFESPFGTNDFRPPDVGPVSQTLPGTLGRPGVPGVPGGTDGGELAAALPSQKTIPGGKGGIAMAVGLAGLAIAIALAGADWYRMRKYRMAAQ